MAYAARVMRTLIIDYVRSRKARKRGGVFEITSLDDDVAGSPEERSSRSWARRWTSWPRSIRCWPRWWT